MNDAPSTDNSPAAVGYTALAALAVFVLLGALLMAGWISCGVATGWLWLP